MRQDSRLYAYLFSRLNLLLAQLFFCDPLRLLLALQLALPETGEIFGSGLFVEGDLFNLVRRLSLLRGRRRRLLDSGLREHGDVSEVLLNA